MIDILQVYTGNGKGKTTAAIGLSIRALGAGQKVYIMQFMKSIAYSEHNFLKKLAPNLVLETTGKPFFLAEEGVVPSKELEQIKEEVVIFPKGQPPSDYIFLIEEGFQRAKNIINSGHYDLIILDEINVALFFDLLSRQLVEDMLDQLALDVEIICTGRNAPKWLIDRADLVTEMREVKHYYNEGVMARKGIEN